MWAPRARDLTDHQKKYVSKLKPGEGVVRK